MTQTSKSTNSGNVPQIILTPLKSALIAGHAQRVQVLVRIQAPDADPATIKPRPPYHLALVIDHSGSMSGEPLHEAKRCARHIIDQLKPDDRASLVQFDSSVDVLVPAKPVGDRKALHRALIGIDEGDCTNLHGGWEAGGQALLEHIQQAGLSRIRVFRYAESGWAVPATPIQGHEAMSMTRIQVLQIFDRIRVWQQHSKPQRH